MSSMSYPLSLVSRRMVEGGVPTRVEFWPWQSASWTWCSWESTIVPHLYYKCVRMCVHVTTYVWVN